LTKSPGALLSVMESSSLLERRLVVVVVARRRVRRRWWGRKPSATRHNLINGVLARKQTAVRLSQTGVEDTLAQSLDGLNLAVVKNESLNLRVVLRTCNTALMGGEVEHVGLDNEMSQTESVVQRNVGRNVGENGEEFEALGHLLILFCREVDESDESD